MRQNRVYSDLARLARFYSKFFIHGEELYKEWRIEHGSI